jgi:hypothetical protein
MVSPVLDLEELAYFLLIENGVKGLLLPLKGYYLKHMR